MRDPVRQQSSPVSAPDPDPRVPEEASSGALIASAVRDTQELARSYLELARLELGQQLAEARRATASVLTGLTMFLVSLPFIIWSVGMGLAQGLDLSPWAGILIAAVVPFGLGVISLVRARPQKAGSP